MTKLLEDYLQEVLNEAVKMDKKVCSLELFKKLCDEQDWPNVRMSLQEFLDGIIKLTDALEYGGYVQWLPTLRISDDIWDQLSGASKYECIAIARGLLFDQISELYQELK